MTWPFENDTGAMPADAHSILLGTGYQKHHSDMDVGATNPEIESFDYSWSIVSDLKKAESVESSLQELVSGRSNLGMDTIRRFPTRFPGFLQMRLFLLVLFGMEVILSVWMVRRQ